MWLKKVYVSESCNELRYIVALNKRHHFSGKYTFPMVDLKIGVAFKNMNVAPFTIFTKLGETFSSLIKP